MPSNSRKRHGVRERIETGIYREHRTRCTTARCACPYLISYQSGGRSMQETIHGSLTQARRRRAVLQAKAAPSPRVRAKEAADPRRTMDAHFTDLICRRASAGTWAYNTARRHEEVWTGGLSKHFGRLRVRDLPASTEICWERFLAETPGRVSHHLQAKRTLSVLCETLRTQRLLDENPARRLRVPARSPDAGQQVDRVLDAAELALLLRKGPTSMRQRTLLATLAMGGLRRAETLALRVGDIDLDAAIVRVERQAITIERERDDQGRTLVAAHRRIEPLKGRQRRDWHRVCCTSR